MSIVSCGENTNSFILKILFLSLSKVNSLSDRGIYTDLLRELISQGHDVSVVTPVERRDASVSKINIQGSFTNLHVRTLNIQKTNIIEKGIGTLLIGRQFLKAIHRFLPDSKFDLILYATPPVTLYSTIKSLKKFHKATTYLLLKDIFPQNAIDLKMMKEGWLFHRYFKYIERKLYQISDHIGCMSPANVQFIINHHDYVAVEKLHTNPNSIEPITITKDIESRVAIRTKYNLPIDKDIVMYGGNLGVPQGIGFLIEILEKVIVENVHYLIVGSGSEYDKIKNWCSENNSDHVTLLSFIPKEFYDKLLASCDIGLILLNKNFLIPNFPSRLLSYLEMGLPVISATDPNTDIGDILEENNCGKKVLSGDIIGFKNALQHIISSKEVYNKLSENAIKLLHKNYTVKDSVQTIFLRIDQSKTMHDV
jgi:glycosyltransferase involved in cell wall biosynthesis